MHTVAVRMSECVLTNEMLRYFNQSEISSDKVQILKQWTLISNMRVCPRTIKGRQMEIGLRGCKVCSQILLTEFQSKRRLTWAREHSLWIIKDWNKVIFSDEIQIFFFFWYTK